MSEKDRRTGGLTPRVAVAAALFWSLAVVSAADDALQEYRFQPGELDEAVRVVVQDLYPEADLLLTGEEHGVVTMEIAQTGLSPAPRIFLFGGAVGQIGDARLHTGHAGEYEIPQMALLFALDEGGGAPVRCGYALFEPTFRHGRLRFGGLKRLASGTGDAWACLCGTVEGAADRYALGESDAADGLDEVQVRPTVRDLRVDAADPPVNPGVCVVDLHDQRPLVLENRVEESSAALPPVWLDLSGADEIEIRVRPRADEESAELPSELADWKEKFPKLVLKKVERKEGGVVSLRGIVPGERDVLELLRDLRNRGNTRQPMPDFLRSAEGAGFEFSLRYRHAPEE